MSKTFWPLLAEGDNNFNFLFGPDPQNLSAVATSKLIEVIKEFWGWNVARPSDFGK